MRPLAATSVRRWTLAILAATTMWWSPGTPQALSAAELVMFEARACAWCAAWDDEVGLIYAKTPEGKSAPLRRVDLHGPRPADLADLEALRYTPTFVLLDRGREIGRILGYPGESNFWGLLALLLEKIDADPSL